MAEATETPTEELIETEAPHEGASDVSETPEPVVAEGAETQPETSADVPNVPTLSQGEDGRWRRADGTYASAEEIAAQSVQPSAVTPPATTPPVEPQPQPWKFKADRQEHTIEGAVLRGDKLEIPVASLPRLQSLLQSGVAHQGSWQKERQTWGEKIRESQTRAEAAETKFTAIMTELDRIFHDENALIQFYQNYQTQKPALMERARAAELEAQLQAYRNGQVPSGAPNAQADPHAVLEAAKEDMTVTLGDYFEQPEFQVFTDEDRQYLTQQILDDVERYVKIANQDIPEHGIVKGDRVLLPDDEERLVARLKREAERVGKFRKEQQEQAKKVAEAAQFNARRQPAQPVAPAVPASKPSAPGEPGGKRYQSVEDWRKDMGLY